MAETGSPADHLEIDLDVPAPKAPPHRRRFALFGAAALLATVVTAALLANMAIDDRRISQHAATAARLQALADGTAEVLTTWLDGVAELGNRLTRSQLVQLYMFELSLPDRDDDLSDALTEQQPYMQEVLTSFVHQNDLVAAYLVANTNPSYLGSAYAPPLTAEQRAFANTLAGERRFSAIKTSAGGMVIDVALPIEPPPMPDTMAGHDPAGVLLVTIPAGARLERLLDTGPLAAPGARRWLLQNGSNGPQRLTAFDAEPQLDDVADVMTPPGTALTYSTHDVVGLGSMIAVGVPVERLGATLIEAVEAREALAPLHRFRSTVIGIAALGALILATLFLAFWWRQSEVHYRVMVGQYRDLAGRILQQRLLLESITESVQEMIGLKGRDGLYRYVNKAFARAARLPAEAIVGLSDRDLVSAGTAARFDRSDREAMAIGITIDEEEEVDIGGRPCILRYSRVPVSDGEGRITGIVSVAQDVTDAINQRRRHDAALKRTIGAFTRAIELADPWLLGHSRRLQQQTAAMADTLGLDETERTTLDLAAGLSQIGKIFVPQDILTKPQRHTPAEMEIMRAHIGHAVAVLRDIDFELPIAEVVGQMHERLDGSGYPRGIEGEAINRLARILGAVDVYCARTAPRSYRDRIDPATALHFLADNPERYDTDIVATLTNVAITPAEEPRAAAE